MVSPVAGGGRARGGLIFSEIRRVCGWTAGVAHCVPQEPRTGCSDFKGRCYRRCLSSAACWGAGAGVTRGTWLLALPHVWRLVSAGSGGGMFCNPWGGPVIAM